MGRDQAISMTPRDYQLFIDKMWFCKDNVPSQVYCVLGLVGEAGEFEASSTKDSSLLEAGDLLFYTVRELTLEGTSFPAFLDSFESTYPRRLSSLLSVLSKICEKVKKHYRDTPEIPLSLQPELKVLWASVIWKLSQQDISFEDVIEANVQKLQSRLARGKMQGSGDYR